MKKPATPEIYDEHIRSQSLEFQVDNYYEPKKAENQLRIDEVIKNLDPRPGEVILDLGCGVGTFAFHASKAGAECHGLDYSPESIRVARLLTQRYSVKGKASFLVGDAKRLPFPDSFFDKVVSADFMEHITDEEKDVVLGEVKRVLKPGGRFVVFTPNRWRERIGEGYWKLRHLFFGNKIPVNELHYGLIARKAFERLLRKHGYPFTFRYVDVTRPYLAKWPVLNRFLSLNLLWTIYVKS